MLLRFPLVHITKIRLTKDKLQRQNPFTFIITAFEESTITTASRTPIAERAEHPAVF
jgi:hypothetical protein